MIIYIYFSVSKAYELPVTVHHVDAVIFSSSCHPCAVFCWGLPADYCHVFIYSFFLDATFIFFFFSCSFVHVLRVPTMLFFWLQYCWLLQWRVRTLCRLITSVCWSSVRAIPPLHNKKLSVSSLIVRLKGNSSFLICIENTCTRSIPVLMAIWDWLWSFDLCFMCLFCSSSCRDGLEAEASHTWESYYCKRWETNCLHHFLTKVVLLVTNSPAFYLMRYPFILLAIPVQQSR